MRAYCTFASKQAVSVTLFGPCPNNKEINTIKPRKIKRYKTKKKFIGSYPEINLKTSPLPQPRNIAMKTVFFPFLYSCLGFQNLKNVPPSGLNFSCQYVWCISIKQFCGNLSQVVDRGIVHWICRLNALYEVYYVILIYSYDSLIDSSFLNILLAKHFLTRYLWMLTFALQGFVVIWSDKKVFYFTVPQFFFTFSK